MSWTDHFAKRLSSLIVLWSLVCPLSYADHVAFKRIGQSEGLSQTNIFAMIEDSEGYLWFGTQNAADRFDGYSFTTFRHLPDDSNSLAMGSVRAFHNGPDGRLWIATALGLSVYDPKTKAMTQVFRLQSNPTSAYPGTIGGLYPFCEDRLIQVMSTQEIWEIDLLTTDAKPFVISSPVGFGQFISATQDRHGQLWLSDGAGLWVSNCETYSLDPVRQPNPNAPEMNASHSIVTTTPLGHIAWVGAEGIEIIDSTSKQVIGQLQMPNERNQSTSIIALGQDAVGALWIVSTDALFRILLDDNDTSIRSIKKMADIDINWSTLERIPSLYLAQSGDGLIWVSVSDVTGMYRISTDSFTQYKHDPMTDTSLPATVGQDGYRLYPDRFGNVWFGARLGGTAVYIPERHRFHHLKDNTKLSYVVRGVAEERVNGQRFVWIGLDDGGIQLWEEYQTDRYVQHAIRFMHQGMPTETTELPIRTMATHPITGDVWFTSMGWFGRLDAKTKTADLISPLGTLHSRRFSLAFSPDGSHLYQSIGDGLIEHRLNAKGDILSTQTWEWLSMKIDQAWIRKVHVLPSGALLVATGQALFHVTPWNQVVREVHASNSSYSLAGGQVRSLLTPETGDIWVGSVDSGLIHGRLEETEDTVTLKIIRSFDETHGLADRTIYAIASDKEGFLWLSTNQGLTRLNPITSEINNYTVKDGLQGSEFNTNVVHQTPLGEIYFGGVNGVNLFKPSLIQTNPKTPDLRLVNLSVNNEAIDSSQALELGHESNNWVIQYAGLHFTAPEYNRYSYRLLGLDAQWVDAGTERVARYSGLPPGSYQFWARASNSDGAWSSPQLLFEATVLPPWWASSIALLIYTILIIFMMVGAIHLSYRRQAQLKALVQERTQELHTKNLLVTEQAQKLEEALSARTMFFANVSHELKTPLTLIDANLNALPDDNPKRPNVVMAQRYLKRMSHLIDQLLDLSHIQDQGSKPEAAPWSLDRLIRATADDHRAVASQKQMELTIESIDAWHTQINRSSVVKIVQNLLSNALKYTANQGHIWVTLEPDKVSGVWLRVRDNGRGLSAEESELIFDRFYRVPAEESDQSTGAGVGLTLVSDAVKAIGGLIQVDSQLGLGSTFSVWLPAERQASDGQNTTPQATEAPQPPTPASPEQGAQDHRTETDRPSVLVVEDNADLRQLVSQELERDWVVYQAVDGHHALQVLTEEAIDVILSDIMMPRMDGFALLRAVREDLRVSHIPFLFLTARVDDETELEGLMLSADDFIRKPFNQDILEQKLKNTLESQRRSRMRWGETATIEVTQGQETSPRASLSAADQRFVERITAWIPEHFSDPNVTVGDMASALLVEERTLQRKLKALYAQTPTDFLHNYRIHQATEYLKDPSLTIQEVAYQCGYNSTGYFSKTFAKFIGCTPSEWRNTRY